MTNIEKAHISRDIYQLTHDTRDLVENEYKAGTALVTRLNEAENSVISAQHSLLSAVINASNAKAQLEAAVYAFSDRDMKDGEGTTVSSSSGEPVNPAANPNESASGSAPAAVPAEQQSGN